jgi:predicted lipid-binding transport protein (Tim44 family)
LVKVVGWLLGIVAFGGLIVMSIAGATAAVGVLVTAIAIVAMIALGNLLGGRTTANRQPYQGDKEASQNQRSVGGPEEK